MTFLLRSLCLLLVAGFVSAAEPASRLVIVFGDSIAQGGMLPQEQQDQVWVKLVEREAKGRLTMVNESKGGRPTDSVAEFQAMLTRRPQADLIVIALGTNDSRNISGKGVLKAVANVRQMIAAARAKYGEGAAILLLGPPNIRKDALGPTKPIADQREANLREIGDAFSTLAKETHCDYLSTFGAIPEVSLAKDGVHPDAAGNVALAKVILPSLLAERPKK